MNKRNITSFKKEYIGNIKINLNNGQSECLKIYEDSDTDDLAYNFCLKHKLDFEIVKKLIEKINFIKRNRISPKKGKEEISFNIKNFDNDKDKENIDLNDMNSYYLNGYDSSQKNFITNNLSNASNGTGGKKSNIFNLNIFNNGIINNKEFSDKSKYHSNEIKKYKNDKTYNNLSLNSNINNNLDKSYNNYNSGNKLTNADKNTKEIIHLTIQKCMSILEKEENNDLELLSSEFTKNYLEIDKDYNSAPLDNVKNNINTKNHYNNNLYLTPDLNEKESFNSNNLNNNISPNTFNYNSTEKENSKENKIKRVENNLKINEIKTENFKPEKFEEALKSIPQINYNIKNVKHFNNNSDNIKNSSIVPINNHKESNLKIFNNIYVEHEIEFSLISKKRNYLLFCPYINLNKNSESNNIIHYKKNISRKFHMINSGFCHLHKNTISYSSQNKNNFLFFGNNKNTLRAITNYSSLKTIPNNEKENLFLSTLKTFSNASNGDLLSSDISEKSNYNQIKVNIMSNSNYSNIMKRASKYKILSRGEKTFNPRKIHIFNKYQKNKFASENNVLSRNKEQKEENNKYKQNTYNKTITSQNNKINIKNNCKKIKKRNFILNNKNNISNDSLKNCNGIKTFFSSRTIGNSSNYSLLKPHIFSKTLKNFDSLCFYRNKIKEKLIEKNEILNCFRNIFNAVTKNNKTLDAFNMINKNNIPSPIYEIVKFIVKNCQNKNRFIEYEEFINKALTLFDNFSKEEKISILNYNKYL